MTKTVLPLTASSQVSSQGCLGFLRVSEVSEYSLRLGFRKFRFRIQGLGFNWGSGKGSGFQVQCLGFTANLPLRILGSRFGCGVTFIAGREA